jgi:MOSC domain-containing protein YiiM
MIGQLRALTLRPARGAAPLPVAAAVAIAGAGLEHDVHADPLSPRQLLLAGADAYAALALAPHALRENLLLDIDTAQLHSGTVLQVGGEVRLRLMFQCEACGQLDLQRPGLARALGPRRGMLARVLAGGVLRVGDPVHALGPLLPAWPDDWRLRVARVLDAAAPGTVVTYAQLARLAGIQSSYCRALPALLRKLGPAYAGKAVAQGAALSAPRWQGEGLFDADGRELTVHKL